MPDILHTAWSVRTPRLELRAYDPSQTTAVVAAVAESLDHLRPTMPFAAHAPDEDTYAALFVGFRARFAQGDYTFSVWTLAALCHLAFVQEGGVDRVEARIEPSNAASIRVAEKAGLQREALLRRRIMWPGEAPRDAVVYTLFADDWPRSPSAAVPVQRLDAAGRPIR